MNHLHHNSGQNNKAIYKLYFLCQNMIKIALQLTWIAFRSPIQTARLISFTKLGIMFRAVRNETPKQISEGFRRQLINMGDKFLIVENNYPSFRKKKYLAKKKQLFQDFIQSNSRLEFSKEQPKLSIVLVFYNQAELSFACLQSIYKYIDIPFELIIIDNHSTDDTPLLLNKIEGASIIRNSENQHFLKACNQAISVIKGDYTLFLNNDAELLEGSIKSAIQTIEEEKDCGAVGGKIILPNGKLQEAGSIIWNDGSCLGYGRDHSPNLSEFNFKRVVDYCSGAFLLTKTNLFKEHGGFDIRFEPAYYEETDYCLCLQERGMHIIYDPNAVIRHFEFGSGLSEEIINLHQKNQKIFFTKHKTQLEKHARADYSSILNARFAASQHSRKKILYIDDRVPHSDLGTGFPRANAIIHCIKELGYQLTIYPLNYPNEDHWKDAYRDIDPFIEITKGKGLNEFRSFIKSREKYYNYIWISRPHNLKSVKKHLLAYASNCKIIYDAEAIFTDREIIKKQLKGRSLNEKKIQSLYQKEIQKTNIADLTLAVCKSDAKKFMAYGVSNVKELGHSLKIRRSTQGFENRKGLLFVGNLDDENSPNVDSVHWLVQEILPIVKRFIPEIELDIIGSCKSDSIQSLESDTIHIHGRINNLSDFYDRSKVFVAPTRFAAGLPYKIHEAAANGLPVVATEILGKQLAWGNKKSILITEVENTAFSNAIIELYNMQELWKSIQKNAYQEIENELSFVEYKKTIAEILTSLD